MIAARDDPGRTLALVPTALVTGATSGLGAAFARRLAAEGYDLVLVARDEHRLGAVAAELRATFGRVVEVLPADLTDADDCGRVEARLADATAPVDVLVNNAGRGTRGSFASADVDAEQQLLDLLVRAPMRLTHAAVAAMVPRRRGAVVNVSSVAGWLPGGTYSAAKSWVTVFSESVAAQLAGTGVYVMALAPGFVRTEFHQRMDVDRAALAPGWAWLDPDAVVDRALRDLRAGRVVSVPSLRYQTVVALLRHLPPAALRQLARRR